MRDFEDYGFMCEKDISVVTSLKLYKDMTLFLLEDYFFNNKFKKDDLIIRLPWITFWTGYDMHPIKKALNLNMFKINESGIEYNERNNYALVSPDFFCKIFIERITEISYAHAILDKYKPCKCEEIEIVKDEEGTPGFIDFEDHIDFIKFYEFAKAMHRDIKTKTKGRKGFVIKNRAVRLRKLEIGAHIQKFIEDEFKLIEEDYGKELLARGYFGDLNDEDSKRMSRDALSEARFRLKHYALFDMKELTTRLSNSLKRRISKYEYPDSDGRNIKINDIGLDEMYFFAHPSDKVKSIKSSDLNNQYKYDEECDILEFYPINKQEKSDREIEEKHIEEGKSFIKKLSFENPFDF